MKLVVNRTFGGFGLSKEACRILGNEVASYDYNDYLKRGNKELVAVVEQLGEKANGYFAKLRIMDIPDDATDYIIQEYDGYEKILYVEDGKIFSL